jgi:hypothetical protein
MRWRTRKCSSYPLDGRAFLEKDLAGVWHVYPTDQDGGLLEGFPKLTPQGFDDLVAAQLWVRDHVPARLEEAQSR